MANQDLKTFIEDRLRSFDPTIDLDPGSPAQTQLVEPILAYLGTDPFETDIYNFIMDRFAQEFPDVYAGDPSVINDTFVKPLTLLLEPFKRETQNLKNNQSLLDPTILSDDDADALVANFFATRPTGGISSGTARVYFQNPVNVQVEVTTRFYTSGDLSFYPSNPVSTTAEEMVFNREGSLYFMDVAVQAEKAGAEYNIEPGSLAGVTGIYGVLKVTNLSRFANGSTNVDTPTFVAQARESLNERSLVTRRGATARLNDVFAGSIRSVQIIGAGDEEMQRDILSGTSPGHAWLTGQVTIYQNIALVMCRTVDDESINTVPEYGDTLYFYLNKYDYPAIPQGSRFIRMKVLTLIAGPMQVSTDPYQVAYLVQFGDEDGQYTNPGDLLASIPLTSPAVLDGGFSKKGTLKISSLPSIGATDLTVDNQSVHAFGHSDVYVRPITQSTSEATITSLVDDPSSAMFLIERKVGQTYGQTGGLKNKFTDAGIDFSASGVVVGDVLTIESGADAGTYEIGKVNTGTPGTIFLLSDLTTDSVADVRYRICRAIHINPFEPKIPKLPFSDVPNNDLQTNIDSEQIHFTAGTTDMVAFGIKVGDTVRVKTGVSAGDYEVAGVLGSKDLLLDRPVAATESNLVYEIFTPLESVLKPLVRIKSINILDSAKQSTGISVPYADPVAVIPTGDFTSAKVRGRSQRNSGYVLPQINDGINNYVTGGNVASSQTAGKRYSAGIDPTNGGTYKAMLFANGDEDEFLFPLDASTDGCSYFLATSEDDSLSENFPPVDPKPGDCFTINNGPNAGSYVIRSVSKFRHKTATGNTVWNYFIKIYGKFPADILRQIIDFCDANGAPVTKITNVSGTISWPTYFETTYNGLGANLHTALTGIGAASPGATVLQEMVESLSAVSYTWGDPARGVLRSFFVQPTLFEQRTALAEIPTYFSYKTGSGEVLKFRPSPNLYETNSIVPAVFDAEPVPTDFPRDITPFGSIIEFVDTSQATMFQRGVRVGDTLSVHREIFFHGSTGANFVDGDLQTAVQTVATTNVLTAPTASGSVFTIDMVGNILYMDEGPEAGVYTVVDVPNGSTLVVDRPMSVSTPAIILQGNGAEWGLAGATNKVRAPSVGTFSAPHIGKWITLYGIDSRYQGSYVILAVIDSGQSVSVGRATPPTGDFPAFPVTAAARWVITDAPPSTPSENDAGTGTELYGLRPIRLYDDVVEEFAINGVQTDLGSSIITVVGTPTRGIKQPYQIYRKNIRRITPKMMSQSPFGSLFYFDTDVVSTGPSDSYNLKRDSSYLTVDDGTYMSLGYRHMVDDFTLTYSTKESGFLMFSHGILSVDNPDSPENMISMMNSAIQVTYEYGDLVQQVQDFMSSAEDRVTSANFLARSFLPTYVSYDATYFGGSAPSVIAKDIIGYIDLLPIENPLDVSELEGAIIARGGNPITPTTAIVNMHDWYRKQWAEFSQNQLGGDEIQVPMAGSSRVLSFIPGPDMSGQTTLPPGERIYLTQK